MYVLNDYEFPQIAVLGLHAFKHLFYCREFAVAVVIVIILSLPLSPPLVCLSAQYKADYR